MPEVDPFAVDSLAMICHEANRAYCYATGDYSPTSWAFAPEWQQVSARNGVRFHLQNPGATDAASHENWMAEKVRDGWTWGPVKDPERKQHPQLVPFAELPIEQRVKDALFRSIVHAVAPAFLGE